VTSSVSDKRGCMCVRACSMCVHSCKATYLAHGENIAVPNQEYFRLKFIYIF
jgi:hypothetical protein